MSDSYSSKGLTLWTGCLSNINAILLRRRGTDLIVKDSNRTFLSLPLISLPVKVANHISISFPVSVSSVLLKTYASCLVGCSNRQTLPGANVSRATRACENVERGFQAFNGKLRNVFVFIYLYIIFVFTNFLIAFL